MRKQIAAANWKMNLTLQQGEQLINDLLAKPHSLKENQQAVFAVPAPYLMMAQEKLGNKERVAVAAQNCYSKKSGAYTGEISVEMLQSIGVHYVVLGHSEGENILTKATSSLQKKLISVWLLALPPFFVAENLCKFVRREHRMNL